VEDPVPIALPVAPEANELLTRNALALLIAMLLDQQVPLERAFSAPADLVARIGHEPTAAELADLDADELTRIFSERPALHRYPKAMAARTQALARIIADEYDGDAAAVWTTATSGPELLKRLSALPGFGTAKSQIFVALLGKQLGVRPDGWREAAGAFGAAGSFVSVADITDEDSLSRVRAYKQSKKAAGGAVKSKRVLRQIRVAAGTCRGSRVAAMTARQQLARLLPVAVFVLLAAVGLRGGITGLGWNGPLRAYGVIIGLVLEVIIGALLGFTFYRGHAAASWSAPPRGDGGSLYDGDDRDVAGSLRYLLRLLLGAAMIAIAVIELLNLHLHLFSGAVPSQKAPVRPSFPPGTRHPAGSGAGGGPGLHVPIGPILYALLILALLGVLVFSVWLTRRAIHAALPGAVPDELAEDSAELLEAVATGRAAMAALDDARAAIIACYAAMEAHLAGRGAARAAADTPDELLRRAIDRGIVRGRADGGGVGPDSARPDSARPDSAARRLTTLFYEARFSTHELGPGTRDAAVAALDDLMAELADTVKEAAS
jgi:uncharacterized HhH-GPD family protein